jgi:hypothetical protein
MVRAYSLLETAEDNTAAGCFCWTWTPELLGHRPYLLAVGSDEVYCVHRPAVPVRGDDHALAQMEGVTWITPCVVMKAGEHA